MKTRWIVIALAACLAACGDETTEPAATEPVATAPTPAPAPAAPSAEEVPVPEDFAARAESEVNEQNFRDQLAGIETELGAQ